MSYLLTVSAFPLVEESSRLVSALAASFLSQIAKKFYEILVNSLSLKIKVICVCLFK
jgi:hypothetical protein